MITVPMETSFCSEERFTQQQFFDWCESRPLNDIHRYELLGGHIVVAPPARAAHGLVEVNLAVPLHRFVADTSSASF